MKVYALISILPAWCSPRIGPVRPSKRLLRPRDLPRPDATR